MLDKFVEEKKTIVLISNLVGRDDKPDEVFEGEPANKDGFGDSEKVVFLLVVSVPRLFLPPAKLLNNHQSQLPNYEL